VKHDIKSITPTPAYHTGKFGVRIINHYFWHTFLLEKHLMNHANLLAVAFAEAQAGFDEGGAALFNSAGILPGPECNPHKSGLRI
jgi:hypothetical protein